MKITPLAAGTALLLCSSPSVLAQTERELDAHEHGAATLDVALDGTRLYLDLETPANNVLGFEHAPSTDAQRDAAEAARAVLESASPFVPDSAADCSLEEVTVDIALAEEDADADEVHAGEHADDDHHGDEEHADGAVHSDVETSHVFVCERPERLGSVATTLFDAFPGFEEIEVRLVGPGGQAALELSPGQAVIDLGSVR